ncbi:MAG: MBL fold metallo-hydrolase [Clostridia bacterium]|nr:MBL fold metallo-hydrolase [Clostridia bacterium]
MVKKIISDFLDSNVFVVSKGNSCIIVDAGAQVAEVEKEVAGRVVEGIFLTHGHYDHAVYALEYAKRFGCKIYCSELSKEYLADGKKNYSEGKFAVRNFSEFEFLNGEGKIALQNLEVEFKQLGGHSRGDMVYKIEHNLFVGDLLIGRDIGRIDLYGGDKQDMIASLESLQKEKYSLMFSGHGGENSKETQDKVTALWLRFLRR